MTWKDVGNFVANAAPTVGAFLGGPAGAAIGKLVSSALGVDNQPDAVMDALKSNPDALVKVKEIEANQKVQLAQIALGEMGEETKQLASVNQTMQAEASSANKWAAFWRPFWGVISALAFFVVVVFASILAYRAVVDHDGAAMTMIPQFIMNMAALFTIPGGILGIAAWHRGMMQRIQAGQEDDK